MGRGGRGGVIANPEQSKGPPVVAVWLAAVQCVSPAVPGRNNAKLGRGGLGNAATPEARRRSGGFGVEVAPDANIGRGVVPGRVIPETIE